MKRFVEFLLIWISQNLAIPFWMVEHIHLSLNVYADFHEIIASCGMNLIVLIGFILDYKQNLPKMPVIDFTPEDFEEFKKLYFEALYNNQEYFIYKNNQIYTEFGKYVIKNHTNTKK